MPGHLHFGKVPRISSDWWNHRAVFVKAPPWRIDLASVFQGKPTGGNQPPACLHAPCSPLIAPLDPQLFSVWRLSVELLMGLLWGTFAMPARGGLSVALKFHQRGPRIVWSIRSWVSNFKLFVFLLFQTVCVRTSAWNLLLIYPKHIINISQPWYIRVVLQSSLHFQWGWITWN